MSVSIVRYPCSPASTTSGHVRSSSALELDEYGKRSSDVFTPTAAAIAIWVWEYSMVRCQAGSFVMSGWVNVCTPSSLPSATRSRARCG